MLAFFYLPHVSHDLCFLHILYHTLCAFLIFLYRTACGR